MDESQMGDIPDYGDWSTPVLRMLYDAVLDEMKAMNAFHQLGASGEALPVLAWAVTDRIDQAFDVKWSPNWVKSGEPHTWSDEQGYHALCNVCLAESGPKDTADTAANWFAAHVATQHVE